MAAISSGRPRREVRAPFDHHDWLLQLWRIPLICEAEQKNVDISLRERIKELNCLYGIARLAERYGDSMDNFLSFLVDFLPLSWQYPEIACVRIVFEDKTYKSKTFKVTKWRQSSQILVHNEPAGDVAIFYLEERKAADEGPFLKEERILLDEVARQMIPLPSGYPPNGNSRKSTNSFLWNGWRCRRRTQRFAPFWQESKTRRNRYAEICKQISRRSSCPSCMP